jgi:Outer membrane protein beta-barrel domain
MKKLVLVMLIVIGFATASNAQKGSLLVYGNLNFASNTDSFGLKSNNYSINPGIGYQFSDKWTAGLNFSFGGSQVEKSATSSGNPVPSGNYNKVSFFNAGPFLRYTYSISSIFSIYGQADFNYLSGNSTPYQVVGGSYTGFGTDLFPAIDVNLKNGFALNFSFGGISYQSKTYTGTAYNPTNPGTDPPSSANLFAFTFGQGATFGISKNFGIKKSKQ